MVFLCKLGMPRFPGAQYVSLSALYVCDVKFLDSPKTKFVVFVPVKDKQVLHQVLGQQMCKIWYVIIAM